MNRRSHPRRSVLPAVTCVLLVYAVTASLLPARGFWIVDNANKFLQLQGMVASGYTSYSLPWPGKRHDPDFAANPIPWPFSTVRNGNLYSIFSPVFSLVSSLPYRAFGFRGLYLLPLAAAVLSLLGIASLGRILGLSIGARSGAVILAGLCTPIWFYAVVFWEHAVALCLCVWSVYFFTVQLRASADRTLVIGSVLAALAVYFRDDLYLFCAVLVLLFFAAVPQRRLRSVSIMLACMVAIWLPLWWFQWYALGHPFGLHLGAHLSSNSGILEHLRARPRVFYNLFAAGHENLRLSILITAPFLLAFLLNPRFDRSRFRIAIPLLALVGLVAAALSLQGFFTSGQPIVWLLETNSLFIAAPCLILAFPRIRSSESPLADPALVSWLWRLCLGYALAYGLVAPEMGSSGIHWGNRFLLPLYGILSLLAAANVAEWLRRPDWRVAAPVALLALSLAAQVYSIHLLDRKKDFSARLNQEIRARPEDVVMTDVWWAPQEMYSVFDDKSVYYVASEQRMEQILRRFPDAGAHSFLFITHASATRDSSAVLEVRDRDLQFFSLAFFEMKRR